MKANVKCYLAYICTSVLLATPLSVQAQSTHLDSWSSLVQSKTSNPIVIDTFMLQTFQGRSIDNWNYTVSGQKTVEDITDWDNYNWIRTPLAQSADYKSLEHMKRADVSYGVKNTHSGLEVKLTNNSEAVAFFLRLSAKDMQGNMITPAYWSDNFISLKPGETRTVTCRVRGEAQIEIEGWNLR